jgi:L-lactate permease
LGFSFYNIFVPAMVKPYDTCILASFFFTICLKYLKKLTWNSFIRTWLPIFTLWYLILIVNLGKDSPIIIGPGYTEALMGKLYTMGFILNEYVFLPF